MSALPRDPLLAAARVLLIVTMGLTLAGAAASAFSLAAVLASPGAVLAWLAEHGHRPPPPSTPEALASLLGMLVVIALITFLGQRLLMQVIDSVAQGAAFVPQNAQRLARMGWLVIAAQLLSIPAGALARFIEHFTGFDQSPFGFSLGGVLLAVVLFVLARVFRQGAAMREELEGTV